MINFLKNVFGIKKNLDLRFVDTTNLFYKRYPIVSAKSAKSKLKEYQVKKTGKYSFQDCPGMIEYSKMGYVVNTFCDLYIKANKAGSYCSIEPPANNNTPKGLTSLINRSQTEALNKINQKFNPEFPRYMGCSFNTMDPSVIDGIPILEDGIPPHVWKLSMPWKVMGINKNISLLVMPPIYQNPKIFDYLHFYPGMIDYGPSFTTVNVVFSIKKKCEIVIPAGEPILHLIPITTTQEINSTYGCSNFELNNYMHYLKHSINHSFYRRFYRINKKYNIREHNLDENIINDFDDIKTIDKEK